MKTYSVIRFSGGQQEVIEDKLSSVEASMQARHYSEGHTNDVVAVVDDDTDEAVATAVYSNGKSLEPGLLRSIIFGLGKCM